MLRIDRTTNRLVRLPVSTLAAAERLERQLQEMICTCPDEFCAELGEALWIIGQEVHPSEMISDRIDLLGVDKEGVAVIIELKRGTNKLQLMQAISYAGMISDWSEEQFIQELVNNYHQSPEEAKEELQDHIDLELSILNQSQRVILIAEEFDPAVLIASQWLHERYFVDIKCFRMGLSREGDNEYLSFTRIYPPIEISSLRRGDQNKVIGSAGAWTDWDAALEKIDNAEVVKFYKSELAQAGGKRPEDRLPYRQLFYRFGGKRRLSVNGRSKFAYVWQDGRFAGDLDFWRQRLSQPNTVTQVKGGQALRFHLYTGADFERFAGAVRSNLSTISFSDPEDFQGPPGQE